MSTTRSVGLALGRIRSAVLTCCWVLGLALTAQVFVWSLATFTSIRYDEVSRPVEEAPKVVTEKQDDTKFVRVQDEGSVEATKPLASPRKISSMDRVLGALSGIAGLLGQLSILGMLPFLAVGIMLAAGSATPGVERCVSGFSAAVVVALLALPLSKIIGVPWYEGAFVPYQDMIRDAEAVRISSPKAEGLSFYGQYLLLPLTCIVGAVCVGLRFGAGVEAGLLQRESGRLDPELEREAANIKASSLHGSRSAAALKSATIPASEPVQTKEQRATEVSPGDAPRRII